MRFYIILSVRKHLLHVSLVTDHMLVGCIKIDLLPKGTDMAAVGDWVIRATLAKKLKYAFFPSRDAKLFMCINLPLSVL